jgi:hypothetical protein
LTDNKVRKEVCEMLLNKETSNYNYNIQKLYVEK